MKNDFTQIVFEEFTQESDIIRISQRYFDIKDEQYAIPKIQSKAREKREVNRLDGHKIYTGSIGQGGSTIDGNNAPIRPVIIKSGVNKGFIKNWEVEDMDMQKSNNGYHVFSQKDVPMEEGYTSPSESGLGISEAKGISKEIIENANKEAQNIINRASEEVKAINEKAYQEGYQNGFAQVNSELDILRKIQQEMHQVNTELFKSSEKKIVDLVKSISEKLFINGLALDENLLKDIVGRAVNEASQLGNLKVYLNPDDLNKLKKLWRESELNYNGQKIQLVSNNEIQLGGVYIEGDYGSVDARIDTQLNGVINALTEIQIDNAEE